MTSKEKGTYTGSTKCELDHLMGNVLSLAKIGIVDDALKAKDEMISRLGNAKKLPVYGDVDASKLNRIIALVRATDWGNREAMDKLHSDIRDIVPM